MSVNVVGSIKNLARVVDLADDVDLQSGRTSYAKYNKLMRDLADMYGYTVEEVTAVFVSTSPNNDYIGNLRSTVSILDGLNKEMWSNEIVISTYNHCKDRALLYLDGVKFLDHAKGLKIRAFYRNIVDPLDIGPVTVDGHMVGAWTGQRLLMKNAAISKSTYKTIEGETRELARHHGLIPNQVQGVIWFTWKRLHNVVYDGNLNLFNDPWSLDLDVRSIKPYTPKWRSRAFSNG